MAVAAVEHRTVRRLRMVVHRILAVAEVGRRMAAGGRTGRVEVLVHTAHHTAPAVGLEEDTAVVAGEGRDLRCRAAAGCDRVEEEGKGYGGAEAGAVPIAGSGEEGIDQAGDRIRTADRNSFS